jgi:hypothetical protein
VIGVPSRLKSLLCCARLARYHRPANLGRPLRKKCAVLLNCNDRASRRPSAPLRSVRSAMLRDCGRRRPQGYLWHGAWPAGEGRSVSGYAPAERDRTGSRVTILTRCNHIDMAEDMAGNRSDRRRGPFQRGNVVRGCRYCAAAGISPRRSQASQEREFEPLDPPSRPALSALPRQRATKSSAVSE